MYNPSPGDVCMTHSGCIYLVQHAYIPDGYSRRRDNLHVRCMSKYTGQIVFYIRYITKIDKDPYETD